MSIYDEVWATNLKHPKYLISSHGRIFSLYSNKYLKPTKNGDGYLRIKLRKNNSKPQYHIKDDDIVCSA